MTEPWELAAGEEGLRLRRGLLYALAVCIPIEALVVWLVWAWWP